MKTKKIEKMDVQCSVFNQHINKAAKRALKVMRDNYPTMHKEILRATKKGIMSIFINKPTNASLMYTALVTAFVNNY